MPLEASDSIRAVAVATVFCVLGIASGCGRAQFDLLPDESRDAAGRGGSVIASSGSAGVAGVAGSAAGASGKAFGGSAGKVEVGGSGGRAVIFPSGGAGNAPCLGEGGCPDEPPLPCSQSDPFCAPCRRNSDCLQDARTCDPELSRCVQCRKNSNCGPGEACNPNTWRCAKACGSVKDCNVDAQRLTCSPDGVCVACIDNGDCAGYLPFNGQCVSNVCVECSENSQCASHLCYIGRCVH